MNDQCQLYTHKGNEVIQRIFGSGIAYPQRRSDGMILKKKELVFDVKFYKYPKVDSFDLYRNSVADTILRNLIPKK